MRIWGSEAAITITNCIVVLIVVMKKYRPTRWTQNWFPSLEIIFSNDFWSVSRSARALGDQTANNCFRRSRGELANGLMATWPERFTELHQSSCPNSSPLRSARLHDLGSAEVCRNVANISFATEPLRKRCLRHLWWWLVIISLFDQRWCPLISQWKLWKHSFMHLVSSMNPTNIATSYQLPTTISHLLVSNKCHKNSPTKNQHLFQPKMLPLGEKSEHMRQLRLMRQVDFATHGQNGLPEINRVLL